MFRLDVEQMSWNLKNVHASLQVVFQHVLDLCMKHFLALMYMYENICNASIYQQ